MYAFLAPMILGFALGGASAFTTAFSRRRGERGGQTATMILRNTLGIGWAIMQAVLEEADLVRAG